MSTRKSSDFAVGFLFSDKLLRESVHQMLEQSIARKSIARIRNKKIVISPNTKLSERIKLLQREMVKLSFQSNRKDDINLIVSEINRLRNLIQKSK